MAPRSLSLARGAGVRRACAGACLLALLAGCGGGGTPGGQEGGLYGTVTRGPITPVCQIDKPCTGPASGAQLVFTRSDGVAARVVVAKDGSYSVSLAPGAYTVTVATPSPIGRGIDPGMVHIDAGPARKVDFGIDTGIR